VYAMVTDQRPLEWASPDTDMTHLSKIIPSPSNVLRRGVVGGGGGALTVSVDSSNTATSAGISLQWTLGADGYRGTIDIAGTNGVAMTTDTNGFLGAFGYDDMASVSLPLTQGAYITLKGCTPTDTVATFETELRVVTITKTTLTVYNDAADGEHNFGATGYICAGDTVTFSTRMAHLADPKGIVVGDRVKVKTTSNNAEATQATTDVNGLLTVTNDRTHNFKTGDRVRTSAFTTTCGTADTAATQTQPSTDYFVTRVSATTFSLHDAKAGVIDSTAKLCTGQTPTIDFVPSATLYETRTVDKVWADPTTGDITTFTVKDPYTNVRNGQVAEAWVDESGTTEELTCGRRGLCESESGICACFTGYTGQSCGTINALHQ